MSTLTVRDAVALGSICDAAIHGRKVSWLLSNSEVLTGVARSIGDERGNFAREDEDIRDCYLRVSATFEHFLPVSEVLIMYRDGTFIVGE